MAGTRKKSSSTRRRKASRCQSGCMKKHTHTKCSTSRRKGSTRRRRTFPKKKNGFFTWTGFLADYRARNTGMSLGDQMLGASPEWEQYKMENGIGNYAA